MATGLKKKRSVSQSKLIMGWERQGMHSDVESIKVSVASLVCRDLLMSFTSRLRASCFRPFLGQEILRFGQSAQSTPSRPSEHFRLPKTRSDWREPAEPRRAQRGPLDWHGIGPLLGTVVRGLAMFLW